MKQQQQHDNQQKTASFIEFALTYEMWVWLSKDENLVYWFDQGIILCNEIGSVKFNADSGILWRG